MERLGLEIPLEIQKGAFKIGACLHQISVVPAVEGGLAIHCAPSISGVDREDPKDEGVVWLNLDQDRCPIVRPIKRGEHIDLFRALCLWSTKEGKQGGLFDVHMQSVRRSQRLSELT